VNIIYISSKKDRENKEGKEINKVNRVKRENIAVYKV
jgi:hypothetical protein